MPKATRALEEINHGLKLGEATQVSLDHLARILAQRTGIHMDQQRTSRMATKITRRMIEISVESLEQYLELLNSDEVEFQTFVNLMTVNKTNFFREQEHFKILSDFAKKRLIAKPNGKFIAWSAAASTGEEAWSIGMVLQEALQEIQASPQSDFRILGTDINLRVLQTASAGVYSARGIHADIPKSLLHNYFEKGVGPNDGYFRVGSMLRDRVKFRYYNLMNPSQRPALHCDAVFLRNVLIYFNPYDVMKAIRNVTANLLPGGLLFLGHCETMPEKIPELESIGHATYRRIS